MHIARAQRGLAAHCELQALQLPEFKLLIRRMLSLNWRRARRVKLTKELQSMENCIYIKWLETLYY